MNKQPAAQLKDRTVNNLMDPVAWEIRVAEARKRRFAALEARRQRERTKPTSSESSLTAPVAPRPNAGMATGSGPDLSGSRPELLHVSSKFLGGSSKADAVIQRAARVAQAMSDADYTGAPAVSDQTVKPAPWRNHLPFVGKASGPNSGNSTDKTEKKRNNARRLSTINFWFMLAGGATVGVMTALWVANPQNDPGTSVQAAGSAPTENTMSDAGDAAPVLVASLETSPVVFSDAAGAVTPFDAALSTMERPDIRTLPLKLDPSTLTIPSPQPLPDQDVQKITLPVEPEADGSVSASPPANTRIRVHVPAGGSEIQADELVSSLRDAGYEVIGPIETDVTIDTTNARFFYDADAAVASAVVNVLAGRMASPPVSRDFTHLNARPSEGTLELWLAGQSETVRTAADAGVDPERLRALVRSASNQE